MPIRKSSVSSAGVPSGTTADRPTDPSIGDTFYNGTLGVQEIYTSSGWLPATGANDFNIVLTGSETSVTLDKEYFNGAYTITSALSDNTFDLYLFDTQGNSAGYTKSPSVNATANFNKIVVLGGQDGDLLSFAYKTTFTTTVATDEVTTGPVIKSISVTDLPNIEDTAVITGANFAENVEVTFTGTNDVALSAKSVVRSSATSLIVTRPDTLIEDHSPYTITITNPGVTPPTGSNGHISINSITAGGDPTWSTTAGELPIYEKDQPYSTSLSATDPDGGPITYSIVSGTLPTGLSLNSSTGEISGTPTQSIFSSIIVAATDSGNNVTNRSFSITTPTTATGGTITTSGGYRFHTFTASGTFNFTSGSIPSADVLIVAGGGAGGGRHGGGGGGGGVLSGQIPLTIGSYPVVIGAGGTPTQVASNFQGQGNPGGPSSFYGLVADGGGGGGSLTTPEQSGAGSRNGGSGGGGGGSSFSSPEYFGGTSTQTSQGGLTGYGNAGGLGSDGTSGGGGGGAGQAGGNTSSVDVGGPGGNGIDLSSIFGTAFGENGYFAGGGGGGSQPQTAEQPGGLGGGGNGDGDDTDGSAGMVNTGGGGGGTRSQTTSLLGGEGGSGIVIIRYPI